MSGKSTPSVQTSEHASFTALPPKVLSEEQQFIAKVTSLPKETTIDVPDQGKSVKAKQIPSNNATVCASEIPITKQRFQNNDDDDHFTGGLLHDEKGSLLARLQLNLLLSQQTAQCNQSSNQQQKQMIC